MFSKDVYRSPPNKVSSYILNNYKKFQGAADPLLSKNQEFSTVHQFPNAPSDPPNFIQGPQPIDPIIFRHKERAYFEYLKKQTQLKERIKEEARMKEAFDMEQKIQRFQEDKLNQNLLNKKQAEELANKHLIDMNYKNKFQEAERNDRRVREEEILNLAKLALQREKQIRMENRDSLGKLAQDNATQGNYRRDLVASNNKILTNEMLNLQERYSKDVDAKEQAYRDKFNNIEKRQLARQQQFQQVFLEPTTQKSLQIDQAINSRFNESQILARQKEIMDAIKANEEKERFKNALKEQVILKEDLELEMAKKETEDLKKRLEELNELKQQRKMEFNAKKFKEKEYQKELKGDKNEWEMSLNKFYGIEDEDADLAKAAAVFYGLETNESKAELSPAVNSKTSLKTVSHDPITGSLKNYKVERNRPHPLGKQRNEEFPGKIADVQLEVTNYEYPKFGKKVPKNKLFNPLTGESREFDTESLSAVKDRKLLSSLSQPDLSNKNTYASDIFKIGKIELPTYPVSLQQPVYKGMGYKRSSIFG